MSINTGQKNYKKARLRDPQLVNSFSEGESNKQLHRSKICQMDLGQFGAISTTAITVLALETTSD